ncbi:hypothetical protein CHINAEXTREME_04650 [Halobiforma lacisalsi AJ5]|uniref:Uncharacterized protein n=1 Tax=Natronobacterium lacisalsi AJ5 TaxID=358396 RepID=M0LQV6_NATLA|nr:hypothetical protein [Halobiforma lacisalsi]APW97101.1 hypothetical protein CHINAEXTREME_04650 [Halobiforma lacisalsi AJ5]EMA34435.1 hypothetical protein C445_07912 [Halobiforma lacisalsi AJ5]
MALQQLLGGDPSKRSKIYLAIGGISLVKAIAVRKDPDRFRRELRDAALFLGVGIVLRQYSQVKAQKREELESSLPDWLVGSGDGGAGGPGIDTTALQEAAKQRFGGEEPEPQPESGLRARARGVLSM